MRRTEPAAPQRRDRWPLVRRYGGITFGVLVLVILVQAARRLDWSEVLDVVMQTRLSTLAVLVAGALASHALFACLDLASRGYARVRLARFRVWLTGTVCYAAALNLGALVGSLGLRVRLYRRQKVRGNAVSRMVLAGVLGNWSGYVLLLAIAPWFASAAAKARWSADVGGWPVAVIAALVCTGYLVACARGIALRWRSRRLPLPPLRLAGVHLLIAAGNWALMGALLWLAIGADVAYVDVLLALLVAAVAGVILHIPGGWGVLEFSVALLLSDQVPATRLVAGVLLYRAAYYLVPFALAAVNWIWIERSGSRPPASRSRRPLRVEQVAA